MFIVQVGCPSTPGEFKVITRSPQNVINMLDVPDLSDGCAQVPFSTGVVGRDHFYLNYSFKFRMIQNNLHVH